MRPGRLLSALVAVLAVIPPARADEPTPEQAEFFEKKVRPVLAEHCYKCHSTETKRPKAGLRVDSRAALLQGGDNGPSLVPGDPAKSRLVEAVGYKNVDLQMPPRAKLPEAAIADLAAWVKMGAPWPGDKKAGGAATYDFDLAKRKQEHWSWRPIRKAAPPAVKDGRWPAGAIDRFVLATLEAKGLKPAADAEARVLIRRAYFDLIGLPPAPAEVNAFVRGYAANPQAEYERLIDGLLASPHFGERWGRHWLDLVRYAETRGHEFDYPAPNAYQYRDYVVRALNADLPYDQLVREHLAGDLLPGPRLHPRDGFNESVLGTGFWFLGEQLHSPVDICQDKADRFDNMLDVATKAFLGLTVACARCHDHKFDAISTRDYYALCGFLESSSYRLVPFDTLEHNRRVADKLAKLRARARLIAEPVDEPWQGLMKAGVVADYTRPDTRLLQDGFAFHLARPGEPRLDGKGGMHPTGAAVYDAVWDRLKLAPGAENEPGPLGSLVRSGRTLRTPSFTVTTGRVFCLMKGSAKLYAAVEAHGMLAGPLHGSLVRDVKTPADDFHWVEHNLTAYVGRRAHLEFTPPAGSELAVAMVVQGEQPARVTPVKVAAPPELAAKLDALRAEYAKVADEIRPVSRLAPAMLDGSGVDEHVFIRGNYKTPGEVVPRRHLEALAGPQPIKAAAGSGRLELARQFTDPAITPHVPRVMANRVWHHLFGRGLVASVDNFGVLGEEPSHPELLDHLADHLVKEGWSLKKLIRAVVLSRAYRMASEPSAEASKVDPQNRLVHRQNIRRLEGEAIRDAILAASGRLDRTAGGPSVPVYLTDFQQGRGRPASGPLDGNGRRSLYLAVPRNFLPSLLLAFDTPVPFSTVGRRTVSNVPAQALILLNDPFVHQQAGVWAKTLLATPAPRAERVRTMYETALGRPPTDDELRACLDFVGEQTRLTNEPAAWAGLAHVLFNTKEFIFLQ